MIFFTTINVHKELTDIAHATYTITMYNALTQHTLYACRLYNAWSCSNEVEITYRVVYEGSFTVRQVGKYYEL